MQEESRAKSNKRIADRLVFIQVSSFSYKELDNLDLVAPCKEQPNPICRSYWAAPPVEHMFCQCSLLQKSCKVCSGGKAGAFPVIPVDPQRFTGADKFMHGVETYYSQNSQVRN